MDGTTGSTNAEPVTELAALVRAVNDSGVSFPRMEKRARDAGEKITSSYLHQIARGKVKRPTNRMIPAIARALAMTETQVREAAARQAGVHVTHNVDQRTGDLLSLVEELGRTSRERWHRLSQAIAITLAAEDDPSVQVGELEPFSQRRLDAEMAAQRDVFRANRLQREADSK